MTIFVTSDHHLGHQRIIQYCNRPFSSVEEMNNTIINNWNRKIKSKDTVFFIGDMSYRSYPIEHWIPYLNGKITFIKGNHDTFDHTPYYHNYILKYKRINFFLTHDPSNVPWNWHSWAICGHHHNNFPETQPFYNKLGKRFNVSVEMTGYKPVNMDYIYKLATL